jgi:hypothetical protein
VPAAGGSLESAARGGGTCELPAEGVTCGRHYPAFQVPALADLPEPPAIVSQALDDRLYYCEQFAESVWIVTVAGGRGMTLAPAIAEQVLDAAGVVGYETRTASSTGA